jgi:hypothetical protein
MKGEKMSHKTITFVAIIAIVFCVPALITWHEYRDWAKKGGDEPLSNREIMAKSDLCHKRGMAIQMIYDDIWDVYAVKCVPGGFTGDGRRK